MDEADTDVVKVEASNTLVPNLTICVDNEEEDDGIVEFVDKIEMKIENENTPNVSFEANKLPNHNQKVYENKVYSTYEGMSPDQIREKIRKRAHRFSSPLTRDLPVQDDISISDEEVKQLMDKLQLYNDHLNGDDVLRENCLYLKGVHEMSTDDIFGFLDAIPANRIEWINDYTCNAVWSSAEDAVKSYLHYTKQENDAESSTNQEVKKPPPTTTTAAVVVRRNKSVNMEDDELNLEDSDQDEDQIVPDVKEEKPEIKNEEKMEIENNEEEDFTNKSKEINKTFLSKRKENMTIRARFATLGDKKVLGAGKASRYYIKHGNPNYGGVKGILSRSYKRKFNNRKTRNELDSMNVPFGGISTVDNDDNDNKRIRLNDSDSETEKEDQELLQSTARDLSDAQACEKKSSRRRDDRERKRPGEKTATKTSTEKKSIWSRLGKKKDDDDGARFESRIEKKDLKSRLGPSKG